MSDEPKPTDSEAELLGCEISRDVTQAKMELYKLTQNVKSLPFWRPKKKSWLEKGIGGGDPPPGCRPYPEMAMMIYHPELWKRGEIMLRYADGTTTILAVAEAHRGRRFMAHEVTRKFFECKAGEKDIQHTLHQYDPEGE
jgi:hypothetical protein